MSQPKRNANRKSIYAEFLKVNPATLKEVIDIRVPDHEQSKLAEFYRNHRNPALEGEPKPIKIER
jgi:hypothetical protein